jgi:hypothetical protein
MEFQELQEFSESRATKGRATGVQYFQEFFASKANKFERYAKNS